MDEKNSKYVFWFFFLLIIALSFLIIRPFLVAILTGVLIGYIFYPVYRLLNRYISRKSLSAIIVSILVVLVFTVPLIFTVNALQKDMGTFYLRTKQKMAGNVFNVDCPEETANTSIACRINNYAESISSNPRTRDRLYNAISDISTVALNRLRDVFVSIPGILLNIFIIIFVMFYVFRDGKKFFDDFCRLLPFKPSFRRQLVKQSRDIIYATVYGSLIVALIQGVLGIFGFWIFDSTTSPILWGLMLALAALIPFVGSGLIWVPVGVVQLITGIFEDSNTTILKAIGLLVYGLVVISTIDNVLKPRIIGERSDVHPILVLLGVLGGLSLMGFIGIIFGPLILALLMTFVNVYKQETGLKSRR